MISRRTALTSLAASLTAQANETRPNIVVFLSAGHATGLQGVSTPHLDRMAKEGMRFPLAFVPEAMTAPSRASLFTGLYPMRHGAYEDLSLARRDLGKTWPQWFADLGYRVTLAGIPGIGPRQTFPFDYQPLASVDRYLRLTHGRPFCLVVSMPDLEEWMDGGSSGEQVTVPPFAVDTPATRRFFTSYSNALRRMDAWLGAALEQLPANTLAIYTSSHGPPLPFAQWTLYEAGIRVPFVVRWPGRIKAGSESAALISMVDVAPTLIEAAGGSPPTGIDGRSFLAMMDGKRGEHRAEIFGVHQNRGSESGSDFPIRAIRTARFKYILNLKDWNTFTNVLTNGHDGSDSRHPQRTPPSPIWNEWLVRAAEDGHAQDRTGLYRHRPAEELYDLDNDPYELRNIAIEEEAEEWKKQLRGKLTGWMREQRDPLLPFAG